MKCLLLPIALLVLSTATAQLSLDVACDMDIAGHGNPTSLTVHNGILYFYASNGTNVGELFKFEGGACTLVQDINPTGPAMDPGSIGHPSMLSFGGKLYFTATNGTSGYELFVYDGSTVSLAADIAPGPTSSDPRQLTAFNGKIYFSATDTGSIVTDYELWSYDPATGIAAQVADINPFMVSDPYNFCVYNGKLYFAANDFTTGYELRCYDPITDSVTLVTDLYPGSTGTAIYSPVVAGNKLYFFADDGAYGYELYSSNGTGMQPLTNNLASVYTEIYYWSNTLYFGADTAAGSQQLYKYDLGTNTASLADTILAGTYTFPQDFMAYGNKLYFTATVPNAGSELWVYDGTHATILADINLGTGGSWADYKTVFNNRLYMAALDSLIGNELWVLTDSTLSAKETAAQNDTITLYPNPNDGTFTLRGETNAGDITGIQVINLLGSVVYTFEEPLHSHAINKQVILSEHLSAGTYFLKLQTSKGQQVLRFVKE